MDGFYAIYYTGRAGSGFGVLVLKGGVITGADASGGLYDGEYTVNQGKQMLEGTIKMTVPPGISLVTGVPTAPYTYTQEIFSRDAPSMPSRHQ
jgi:hypothetical protein